MICGLSNDCRGMHNKQNPSSVWDIFFSNWSMGGGRYEKSGDLGERGSQNIQQIVEDFNKITYHFAFQQSKSCPNKDIKGTTTKKGYLRFKLCL